MKVIFLDIDGVFFDDFANKEMEEHLVLTNREVGLTDDNVNDAIKILLAENILQKAEVNSEGNNCDYY